MRFYGKDQFHVRLNPQRAKLIDDLLRLGGFSKVVDALDYALTTALGFLPPHPTKEKQDENK